VWTKWDSGLPSCIPPSSAVPWLHRAGGTTSGVCRSWEEGAYFRKSFLPVLCAFTCAFCQEGGEPTPFYVTCTTQRELRQPFMLGCSSRTTWVHWETERSRRISGPESKTETFFGHESSCFSEIQRESMTRGGFSNHISIQIPLNLDIL